MPGAKEVLGAGGWAVAVLAVGYAACTGPTRKTGEVLAENHSLREQVQRLERTEQVLKVTLREVLHPAPPGGCPPPRRAGDKAVTPTTPGEGKP